MAASPTPRTAELAAAVAVAASGGRDSTALLHCTARLAAGQGLQVVALHVHHGLHPEADDWAQRLRRQVQRWARGGLPVSLLLRRLDGKPEHGLSVEAWARRERYRALAALAFEAGCDTVLLAQHRRDQAETLLLQALRGGGPVALAAMPAAAERAGLRWLRPWLDQPREAIEAYVRRHRLRYVDDASNLDERFARNRLRLSVWPALTSAFPDAETALAGAARRANEAAAALREFIAGDLADCVDGSGALKRAPWLRLSTARRALALRAWLADRAAAQLLDGVPETLVQRLLDEWPRVDAARWPAGTGELQSHDGRLQPAAGRAAPVAAPALRLDLSAPGRHAVPSWQGAFVVEIRGNEAAEGVAATDLRDVELRARSGGERWRLAPRGLARSLKKQYQARRIAAWDRDGPLVYAGGELLYVPGLGVDPARGREAGRPDPGPRLLLHWEPDRPPAAPAKPRGPRFP